MRLAAAMELMDRLVEPIPLGQRNARFFTLLSPHQNPEIVALSSEMQGVQRDHPIPSSPLETLAPIRLSNLHRGSRAEGRVLHGILAADAHKLGTSSVQVITVLQLLDPNQGTEAVLLAIKHPVGTRASEGQIRAAFPRGARVAIKEPILKELRGIEFISLDNPGNVVVLSYLSDSQLELLRGMSPAEIRAQGNEFFRAGSFSAAAQAYHLSSDRAKELENPGDQVLALSNEAECFLKLGRFEDCIDAANEALALDPAHSKSLYRKASALIQLHLYDWASTFLESFTGDESSITELRSRARKLAEQSHSSTSVLQELTRYVEECTTVAPPGKKPGFAEYLGPVQVRMCPDQRYDRGRGLFATRSMSKGEVVLVSKAVSFQPQGERSRSRQDAVVRVLDSVMKSYRGFQQIDALPSGHGALQELQVPEMSLFHPNWITAGEWGSYRKRSSESRKLLQGIDVRKISEIVSKVSFHPPASENPSEDLYYGTWVVPSFINHSCVPNVARTLVGETAIFLATREIEAGEELGWSYICCNHPYRVKRLQEMGMRCECLKCDLERKLEPELRPVNRCYRSSSSPAPFAIKGGTDLPAMVVKLEGVLNSELESEDERQCLRAVHWFLYMAYYQEMSRGNAEKLGDGIDPGGEVIMAALQKFSAGTSAVMLMTLSEFARDRAAAERIKRDEWECRLGKMEDRVFESVRDNVELMQLLIGDANAILVRKSAGS